MIHSKARTDLEEPQELLLSEMGTKALLLFYRASDAPRLPIAADFGKKQQILQSKRTGGHMNISIPMDFHKLALTGPNTSRDVTGPVSFMGS